MLDLLRKSYDCTTTYLHRLYFGSVGTKYNYFGGSMEKQFICFVTTLNLDNLYNQKEIRKLIDDEAIQEKIW